MPKASKNTKDIKYLGRDFSTIKQGLIEFAKAYYPETYTDFNEASPGSLFIDLAAYVGDVVNYYVDAQFKENLVLYAQEKRNLLNIASAFGYKPKISVPSQVDLEVFQLLPVSGTGVNSAPDTRYCLNIQSGLEARDQASGTVFRIQDPVDFRIDTAFSPREVSIYSIDQDGQPLYYLAKKTVKAISATTKTQTFEVTTRERFKKLLLADATDPIIAIESIVDSDGYTWYEVPYLAQDTIPKRVVNTRLNDPDASVYSNETPYLLKYEKVPRRFITRVTEQGLEIQFGAGISTSPDEELLATPEQIGLNLPNGKPDTDASLDPSNPLLTSTYGIAPSSTTLTVTYLVGGGIASNVPSNTINEIIGLSIDSTTLPSNTGTLNATIVNSVATNNPVSATGGRSEETLEEIRQNALAQLATQNRAVTREDYIVRCYSMPSIYGAVAKAYVSPDEQQNIGTSDLEDTVANPLALNLYVLGYSNDNTLTTLNRAVKENLRNYLDQYRMLTDSINIRDAFVINIGVDFDIIPLPNTNGNEVVLRCIDALKTFFNIDRWQVNEPIVYGDIFNLLVSVEGVQTVTKVGIKNLNDSDLGYSNVLYNIADATKNGIIYPSYDPAIFEVKYPNTDIEGRIANF
jgi:hypothetical protein